MDEVGLREWFRNGIIKMKSIIVKEENGFLNIDDNGQLIKEGHYR